MKNLLILFTASIVISTLSYSQLEEGQITYEIAVSSDNSEMAMVVSMFDGSTMNLYFNDEFARTDLDFGSMMSMSTIINVKTDEVVILTGGMMGEKGIITSKEEMGRDEEEIDEPSIEYVKGKKKIAGYKCKKAIITTEEGEELICWYTEKLKNVTTDNNSSVSALPGLAMEYTVDNNDMVMVFTVVEVKTSLDSETKENKFSLEIPEGYEEMSFEEFSSSGGM